MSLLNLRQFPDIFEKFRKMIGNVRLASEKKWSLGPDWLVTAGAYPGFCSMKRLGVFLLFPGWDASPLQVISSQFVRFPQQFAGTHLYSWVERGTVRVKRLTQEHNTMSPARAETRTARSGEERTGHEATAPP